MFSTLPTMRVWKPEGTGSRQEPEMSVHDSVNNSA